MAEEYDLVVLGGGTGGYVAAIRASQLGLKTAIVEDDKLGGTCLHRGCIPTKAYLRSAEMFRQTKEAVDFGVISRDISLDFNKVYERKNQIVAQLYQGVQSLMKKWEIDVFHGFGRILGSSIFSPTPGTISVEHTNGDENTMLIPKNVIIATGSKPRSLEGLKIDGESVLTSDEALDLKVLPEDVLIIGGGVIGIEWASMLADFGVSVTVLESEKDIVPNGDRDVVKEMERLLRNKGIIFIKGVNIFAESLVKESKLSIEGEVSGERHMFTADKILVSVGREANVTNIGLENTDITVDKGVIPTNEFYQTKESHIYAIGDVIGGMQLAHVASHEGITAVEHLTNQNPSPLDSSFVPSCIYSNPEVAHIGLTESQAKDEGFEIKVGKFPFNSVGKALVYGETDGFIKIITNKKNDDLLGIHMIGPHVTDLISEAGLAKVLDATPWEIASTIHPHPSLSEGIMEAALAVDDKQLHG